jgi:hypothetical protein
MMRTSLFFTALIFMALAVFLLGECSFLIPYRALLIHKYGQAILVFSAVLFVNVFAAVHCLLRHFSLADTGRKLAHIDKQLRTGQSILEELSKLLED